jgi:hypothetical protein
MHIVIIPSISFAVNMDEIDCIWFFSLPLLVQDSIPHLPTLYEIIEPPMDHYYGIIRSLGLKEL